MRAPDRIWPPGVVTSVNVLIIDDSAAIRKILRRILGQAGLGTEEIYEAGDGLEALQVLRSKRVGLILADLYMPNLDGLNFLTRLRAVREWESVPVVMITTEGSHSRVM